MIDKKFRSRYIKRLTDFGSFFALLISSTLRGFLIVHAARSGPISRSRSLRRDPAPEEDCVWTGNARVVKLITTAPQTRNYVSTVRHEPRYRITKCPRTKSRFRIAAAVARKNDRPRETSSDTSVNRLGRRGIFLRTSRLHFN